MRRVAFVLSFLVASFAPALAVAADEAPPPLPPPAPAAAATGAAPTTVDAVHLRNGGFFRGRVTEIVPGDHVTIVVAPGGETKRIPWADVDRVIVASTPVPPLPATATPAPSTPATPAAAPMVGPRARVHITSPRQAILLRRAAGTTSFDQVCVSPCDMELPIGDTYRLTGNGLPSNKEIHLQAAPGGTVELTVDPPATGGMIAGGVLAFGGGVGAYIGLLMTLAGAAQASACSGFASRACAETESDGASLRNTGLVTMAVGAGATVLGIIVFINSASTDITQRSGGGGQGDAKAPPQHLDAFLHTPTWRTAGANGEAASAVPAAAFPLVFTGHF